jgi:hypothetical protein
MSVKAKGETMSKTLDAPMSFEGTVFLEDSDGNVVEASVLFGYGKLPNAKDVENIVKDAIDGANKATGRTWHLPTPRNFMKIATEKVCGHRVSIGGPMEYGYAMLGGAVEQIASESKGQRDRTHGG